MGVVRQTSMHYDEKQGAIVPVSPEKSCVSGEESRHE